MILIESQKREKEVATTPRLQEKSSKGITLLLGFFTAISRMLGFFRQIVFTYYFGASGEADIFNFAFNIPNNLRKLSAEGALSSAYIPEISASIQKDPTLKEPSRIVRTLLTVQILVVIPLTLLFVLFAGSIVSFLSDFSDPQKTLISITIFRYLIFYLLLVSLSAILMASLNAVSKFMIPGITPILFSISVIASVFLFHRSLGLYSMVIGVLVGGVAQILFQLPQFLECGFSVTPLLDLKNPAFIRILLRYFPVVVSSGVFMILEMFAHYLGSKMEEGSITSIVNALVVWQLPFGIFSVSIITVLFPKMSRQAHHQDREGLKDSIEEGLSGFFAFIVPSSLFLYFAAPLIVSAIYYRGAFTVENINATVSVLKAYSVGLFFISGFQFLQRYFYASGSYSIPFFGAIVVAIVDIGFSLFFFYRGWGASGLAWSNTICYTVGFLALYFLAFIRLKGLRFKKMSKTFFKVTICMIVMCLILLLFQRQFPDLWLHPGNLIRLLALGGLSLACAIPVLLLYLVLKVEVFSDIILNRFKSRR